MKVNAPSTAHGGAGGGEGGREGGGGEGEGGGGEGEGGGGEGEGGGGEGGGEGGSGEGEGGGGEGGGGGRGGRGGGAGQVETGPATPSVRIVGQKQTVPPSDKTFGPLEAVFPLMVLEERATVMPPLTKTPPPSWVAAFP